MLTIGFMQNFFLILTGITFGAYLLVIAKLLLEFRHVLTAKILSLLLFCSACYLLQIFVLEHSYLTYALKVASIATPAFFWMFTSTLFQMEENKQKLHIGHYLGLIFCLVLGIYSCFQEMANVTESYFHLVSLLTTSTLAVLGISEIFRNWQSDLVECRRILRGGLAATSGTFLLFIVVSEFIYDHQAFPAPLNYINITMTSIFALLFGYAILVSNANLLIESIDELSPSLVKENVSPPSLADRKWLEKLNHAMEVESYYRQVDLTIRSLSAYLNIPEHQLRILINQHLGYRNFNDYLNRYRVRDAAMRLADPELIRLPILTIAIESGYASLTTFNKAFKALKDMTPSEFRRVSGISVSQQLTDF
jgi:AraC-like DNA-binding protein